MSTAVDVSALLSAAALQPRVALVTGANKGVGKEIARALALLPAPHVVILACRDAKLGLEAAEELKAAGCAEVACVRLDLTDAASIESTCEFIRSEYGRLDVLVNNAAVCFNDPTLYGKVAHTPFEAQARITVQTNYFGTLAVTKALLPLLRESSASPRVVNVASWAGRLRGSPAIQEALTSSSLSVARLSELMDGFVKAAEGGTHLKEGWPDTCYGVSKLGLIALTKVLAREEPTLMVNSADPGYCATDQNNNQGYISAAQGAATPALLAHASFGEKDPFVSGKHFYEGREIPWTY